MFIVKSYTPATRSQARYLTGQSQWTLTKSHAFQFAAESEACDVCRKCHETKTDPAVDYCVETI